MPSELKVISLCSYLTEVSNPWRPEDHTASKMVKALKGDEINGYFELLVGGTKQRFDNSTASAFAKLIPAVLWKAISGEIPGNATIVPIPNSHITSTTQDGFKTLDLANEVAKNSGGRVKAVPALVFDKPQQKSRDGGPRSPYHFESAYRIVKDVSGPIILLDDVLTGAGHLIGACWKLKSPRREILLGCTFGSSTKCCPQNGPTFRQIPPVGMTRDEPKSRAYNPTFQ
jgi:hypothetical protein